VQYHNFRSITLVIPYVDKVINLLIGIYSYFLATQHQHNVSIPNTQRAIEGISGSGVLYTIFALVLTCCLGGLPFFAFIGIGMSLTIALLLSF
jgi:hypothetical protein